jgi:hypothetical protein
MPMRNGNTFDQNEKTHSTAYLISVSGAVFSAPL